MKHLIPISLLAILAGSAHADSVSYSAPCPLQLFDISDTLSLPKFSSSFGVLTGVEVSFGGHLESDMRFENLNPNAKTITMEADGNFQVTGPGNSFVLDRISSISTTTKVKGFDKKIDFGGTSGATYTGLFADVQADMYCSSADFSLFEGKGKVSFGFDGNVETFASGSGNLRTEFDTRGSGWVKVVYNYNPVPEPSSLLGIALGVACLVGNSFRKRRAK